MSDLPLEYEFNNVKCSKPYISGNTFPDISLYIERHNPNGKIGVFWGKIAGLYAPKIEYPKILPNELKEKIAADVVALQSTI